MGLLGGLIVGLVAVGLIFLSNANEKVKENAQTAAQGVGWIFWALIGFALLAAIISGVGGA